MGLTDPMFTAPFVDVDEWRDEPVRHRFVHGGFEGTDARFAMYFPPPERYQGRFFQPLMPVSGTEYGAATGALSHVAGLGGYIGFCSDNGGYLVESNLGSLTPFAGRGPDLTLNRTRATIARSATSTAAAAAPSRRSAVSRTISACGTVRFPTCTARRRAFQCCSSRRVTSCGSSGASCHMSSTRSSRAAAATCSRD